MSFSNVKRRKLNDATEQLEQSRDAHTSTGQIGHSSSASSAQSRHDAPAELALASGLYKSSMFKLQVDELLSQLRPDHQKQLSRMEQPLRKLKEIIEDPRPASDSKYTFEYLKPSGINVVGSFALKTQARDSKSNSTVDLAITLPRALFQEKDYVNYRFFHKRAYYIACIAAGIRESAGSYFKVAFDYQDGNTLRPVVIVAPGHEADQKFVRSRLHIRILTEIEEDVFGISRTLPTSNTIRHHHESVDDSGDLAIALYNGALRAECTVSSFLKLMYSATKKCVAYRDACLLGQTWLKQRGLCSSLSLGGFGNFEWAVVVALLMEGGGPNGKPIISPSYSSYQIFKATVQFLASRDLTRPLQIPSSRKVSFPATGSPVLYDGVRGLNVLYKMTPWSYSLLRHEAILTQKMLNDVRHDHFSDIFIIKVDDPLCRFDQLLTISAPLGLSSSLSAVNYQRQIYETLSRALNDRTSLLTTTVESNMSWPIDAKSPGAISVETKITVAMLLVQHNVARLVDHGPSPEEKEEAEAFRQFWGEKSELRRFKDGRIMESLVWSDQDPACSVVHQITSHVLALHLKPKPRAITFVTDELMRGLRKHIDFLEPLDSYNPVMNAFTDLERVIRNLDELPLQLRHLAPCSPFLRYTAVNSDARSRGASPVDVTIEFEGSTRWPDDLRAIEMTKLAFLLKMSEALSTSSDIISCRVGTESNTAFLDVVHCSHVTFRLRVYHEREQMLMELQLKNKELNSHVREELARTLAAHKRTFVHAARHTLAFRTLCTRYPLLSPTIRILKQWASAHLLSPYFHEELLELLAARIFINSTPWTPPANAITGFFRVLHLISRWDWQYEPIVVDLNAELDDEALKNIRTKFEAWRNVDPSMNTVSLFVASNIDTDGVTWTQSSKPPKVVAGRLRVLAKAAMDLAKKKQANINIDDFLSSPLIDYDFVLHLSSKSLENKVSHSSLYKNLGAHTDAHDEVSSTELINHFIDELQTLYGQTILWFHDTRGGKVIGGLWNPLAAKDRPWSLKVGFSTMPKASESEELILNKNAILNEIALLGSDLLQSIEINRL
ncbi:pre-rRNA processing protein Utp22 [Ascosphaera apis ARSEF 7405]|uniref:U3 small nucleolar RNA-associated protein 22 n=1 Tax=Ascosphaera apis ARSEF 7405 TaxID=392613 RepID=A0A167Y745_9EURO|nr:pre-rRNA processing protein Utp22 [Ascosphaera apis ARSEF 7405]